MVWIYTLLSVLGISLISLIGIMTLSWQENRLKNILLFLVSLSVGALFGDAFIHLIPEAFEGTSYPLITSLFIISGILIFFILEKFIRWRHCHVPGHHHPVVIINLVGETLHNFIDGIIVAVAYMVSLPVGISTTLAVILHEIPQEMGDFGVLVHGGLKPKKAVFFNFFSALAAVLGAIITLIIGSKFADLQSILLPITAGGFIYIAGSDLIPELHGEDHEKAFSSLKQLIGIITGLALMAALLFLE